MRAINGILYGAIFALILVGLGAGKRKIKSTKWVEYTKNHMYLLVLLLLINSISFGMTFRPKQDEIYVEREGYGGQEQQVDFLLKNQETTEQISIQVRARQLTKEEQKKKVEEAFSYLDSHLKGENASLSQVTENLDITIKHEKYPFDVEFCPEDYSLIDDSGNLKNTKEELITAGYEAAAFATGIQTKGTVVLWYGETSWEKVYAITVYPKKIEGVKKAYEELKEKLEQREAEALYQEGFTVSGNWQGIEIKRMGENAITPFHVLLFGVLFTGLLLVREKERKRQEELLRRDKLLRCYPWFVNEVVLLLGAGIQMKNILYILLKEYGEGHKQQTVPQKRGVCRRKNKFEETMVDDRAPLIEELKRAQHSMELGMPEEQVYYRLGRQLKLPCYLKLMTLLEQNVKRGTKGLTTMFEQEELAALEERKNLAKRYGEEAGTKLLGPMILLLLVVMLMIMIPAVMSFT